MKKLAVYLTGSPGQSTPVGTLAEHDRRIYFEYDPDFLETRLELSPFKLPLQTGVFEHTDVAIGPLPGLFSDSLPDSWGWLLMDRWFRRRGVELRAISPLERLAYLGNRTMGALTYHPPHDIRPADGGRLDLARLGRNAEQVIAGEPAEVLPQLIRAGGSPGGARPKVLIGLRITGDNAEIITGEVDLPEGFEPWIVKFTSKEDGPDAGAVEYACAMMAHEAGLDMPPSRLFEVGPAQRYFGIRRFDRTASGNRRIHMHTFANLIHSDYRLPREDYATLLRVSRVLTRNHQDVLRTFRLAVFNVAINNCDDHAKNFAFLMDEGGQWSLSPAYDLTISPPGSEHAMTLLGRPAAVTREHLIELARQADIRRHEAGSIIDQVNHATRRWPHFAEIAGCREKAGTFTPTLP